jgi:hypothetical protein
MIAALIALLLAIAAWGCGSSSGTSGYFNMHKLAEAVAQEALHDGGPVAVPSRHEELCIRTGKQTAECQYPVLNVPPGTRALSESNIEKRTVRLTISSDGKSYIAH